MRHRKFQKNIHLSKVTAIKLLSLSLVTIATAAIYRYLFTYTTITCKTQTDQCPIQIQAELERLVGKNILQTNLNPVKAKIMGGSPNIKSISLNSNLPGTLEVKIEYASSLAQIHQASGSAYYVVTDNYTISEVLPTKISGLPTIIYPIVNEPIPGDRINEARLQSSIELAHQLQQNYVPYDYITVASDSAKVTTTKATALFNLDSNLLTQIKSLQLILSQTLERSIQTVDLRFDKPIITFSTN